MTSPTAARPGDWLIVESGYDSTHARTGEITSVPDPDGHPPYHVRWSDDGRETVVFPGPDARVVTAEQIAERSRAAERRIASVQRAITATHLTPGDAPHRGDPATPTR